MEKKTVKKSRRKYDADFKRDVLKLIESGRSVAEVTESLGIGENIIYAWKRQLNKKEGVSKMAATDIVFDDEKMALQKRIQQLEMERDILKKALGIFSR